MSENEKLIATSPKTNLLSPYQRLEETPIATNHDYAASIQRSRIAPGSINSSDMVQLQKAVGNQAATRLMQQSGLINNAPLQKKANNTGLPDNLKAGVENLSGIDISDVTVHYNSDKPANIGALAYTQGTDIHVSPGQERHLPHEAWHVVQQAQGRVVPTIHMKPNLLINDNKHLENEADIMGSKAVQMQQPYDSHRDLYRQEHADTIQNKKMFPVSQNRVIQRMLVGCELETLVPIYENGARPDHVDGYALQNTKYVHHNVDDCLSAPLSDDFEVHVDSSEMAHKSALNGLNTGAGMHIAELVSKPVSTRQALLLNLKTARNFLSTFKNARELTGDKYSMGWPVPSQDWPVKGFDPISKEKLESYFSNDHKKTDLNRVSAQLTFQGSPDQLAPISDLETRDYVEIKKSAIKKEPVKKLGSKGFSAPPKIERIKKHHPIANRTSMAKALALSDRLGDSLVRRAVDVTVKIFKDTLGLLQNPRLGTVKTQWVT